MARLTFVRHSIPGIESAIPAKDWTLSAEGIAAADELARRLPRFDAIVSSGEAKAYQTAQRLAAWHQCALEIDEDLHEHERNAGFLPREAFTEGIQRLFAQPGELVFGGESADQVFSRMEKAVARAMNRSEGDVAIVSHGTALSIYLARVTGTLPLGLWRSLTMPMALRIGDGEVIVL